MIVSDYLDLIKAAAQTASESFDTKEHIYADARDIIDKTNKDLQRDILDQHLASIVHPDYMIVIVTHEDVQQLANAIADEMLKSDVEQSVATFRPITLVAKLSKVEYAIDAAGQRLIYMIQISQQFDRTLAVLHMVTVKAASPKIISNETLKSVTDLIAHTIKQLDIKPSKTSRLDNKTRATICAQIKSKIQNTDMKRNICFLNYNESYVAIDVLYSQNQDKDTFIDMCRQQCSNHNDYAFKYTITHNVDAPGDFRLKKYILLLEKKNRKANGPDKIYLFNLYGLGTYNIIPCISDQKTIEAHPLISIRFRLLGAAAVLATYNNTRNAYLEKLLSEYLRDMLFISKRLSDKYDTFNVTWWGMFKDEDYDKIKYNQFHRHEGEQYRLLFKE